MRVAWVDNAIEWGGVQEHLVLLAGLCAPRGVRGLIVCDPALEDRYRQSLRGVEVELRAIPCHRLASPRSWLGVARVLKEFRPEVVHTHLYWSTRIGAPLGRWVGARLVVETVHLEVARRGGARRILDALDRWIWRWCVDRHIAVSRAVATSLSEVGRVPRAKIAIVHNAVADLPTSHLADTTSPALAFLGRLEPQKGLDVLLRALALLVERGVDFRLEVGGEGSQRQNLEEMAHSLGLGNRVRFVGRVTDRAAFLRDRPILVLPSRYEGFPLVLLEAGLLGSCVVASRVSGIPELVDHEHTGLLVGREDPAELAAALERAMTDEPLRQRLADALRHKVATEFDRETFLDKTMEVLH